jgi:hypothetical protein
VKHECGRVYLKFPTRASAWGNFSETFSKHITAYRFPEYTFNALAHKYLYTGARVNQNCCPCSGWKIRIRDKMIASGLKIKLQAESFEIGCGRSFVHPYRSGVLLPTYSIWSCILTRVLCLMLRESCMRHTLAHSFLPQ